MTLSAALDGALAVIKLKGFMLTQKTLVAIKELQSDLRKAEELRNYSLDRSTSGVSHILSRTQLADMQDFAKYLVDAVRQSLLEALITMEADFAAIELHSEELVGFDAEPVAVILESLKSNRDNPASLVKLSLLFRRAQRWLEVEAVAPLSLKKETLCN